MTSLRNAPQQVVDHFVQTFAAPTHMTGKMARWENGVCPNTLGLGPKFASFITARVREIATQVGAPVDRTGSCRTNIQIVFTTAPQALLDNVRKNHKNYLGYSGTSEQADKLAIVSHPIQSWYETATRDLAGHVELDSIETVPLQAVTNMYNNLKTGGTGKGDPGVREVTGGRLKDGLHTIFSHIIIVADPSKLTDYEMGALADYIAMLSLTQLNSSDVCQQLPSVINSLAPNCPVHPGAISESDLGYLRGLYSMSADGNLRVQQDGIAYNMKANSAGR